MKRVLKGAAFFSTSALVAALSCGCAEEVNELLGSRETEIGVTASFSPQQHASTRAADNLNTTTGFDLLTTTNASSTVCVRADNGSGSYTNKEYSITASKTIAPPNAGAHTFPAGVNTVHVFGWYPYNGGSLTTFTIKSQQTNDDTGKANYCLSDLMLAQPTTSTRSLVNNAWNISDANLNFAHVMSKLKLVVEPASGVTINSITIGELYPTVDISTTTNQSIVESVGISAAKGTKAGITLLTGGSITSSSSEAQKTFCAVFPPQTFTGNFITITATNNGSQGTITYKLNSGKAFEGNTVYPATISVSATDIGSTIDISAWASTTGECTIGGGAGGDAPTLSPESLTLTYGGSNGTITPTLTGASTFSGVSSNTGIATVSGTSTLTVAPVAAGTCTINVFPTNKTGTFSSATCEVTVNKAAQSVSLSESSVSIYGLNHTKTFTVTRSGNGTITAASSNTSIATTSVNQSTGVVTVTGKAAGSATITVTVAEGTNHLAYTASDKNVSVSVVEWDRNGAALSTATSDDIGVAVTTDGKLYYNKTAADAAGKTIAGVLAYSGSTGHGLICALENATSQTWNTINGWSNQTTQGFTGKLLPDAAARGSLTSYTTLGSTAVSNWMVLSKADYTTMWNVFGSASNGTYNSTSNGYITAAGGTACSDSYWSTTEFNGDHAWNFSSGGWYGSYGYGFSSGLKTNSLGVRPVLAF